MNSLRNDDRSDEPVQAVEFDEGISDEALDQPNGTPKSSNFSSVGKMDPVCPEGISDEALDRPEPTADGLSLATAKGRRWTKKSIAA